MKKLLLLLFAWFLIGCSSNSNNESEEVEEKEWVLSEESVMGYDSLTKNYEFVGEWRMDIKMGTVNETLYYEYYNSVDENLCYLMIKVHIPMKLTTLNRCKLTSQSGGEKVSFLAAVIRQI